MAHRDEAAVIEPCPHCVQPEHYLNKVPGHIFVGWGHGWQPCLYGENERLRIIVEDLIKERDLAQRQRHVMSEAEREGAKARIAYIKERYPK